MIYITGDIHGNFNKINQLLNKKRDITHLLVCGDFGYWPKLFKTFTINAYGKKRFFDFTLKNDNTKIHWCDGNHEDFDSLKECNYNPKLGENVYYQKRGSYITLPDNRNVLFLGGGYSIDKQYRTEGVDWFKDELLTEDDIKNLPNINIDVIVSHTAPNEFFVLPKSNYPHDTSRDVLSIVLKKYKPKYWYFGHFHIYKKGKYKNCNWTALADCGSYEKWYERIG